MTPDLLALLPNGITPWMAVLLILVAGLTSALTAGLGVGGGALLKTQTRDRQQHMGTWLGERWQGQQSMTFRCRVPAGLFLVVGVYSVVQGLRIRQAVRRVQSAQR